MHTLILVSLLASSPSVPSPDEQLASMTWLSGDWSGAMWGGTFKAYYSTPEGGKILSHSELHSRGKVRFHEFERFDVRDGHVRLHPYPGGKPATGFKLASLDAEAKKAVFENPKKDYPTRITYHRVAADRLVITLDDPHGEGKKKEVFDLKRARK